MEPPESSTSPPYAPRDYQSDMLADSLSHGDIGAVLVYINSGWQEAIRERHARINAEASRSTEPGGRFDRVLRPGKGS